MSEAARDPVRVRCASEADLPRIVDIYNHEVTGGLTTLDTRPLEPAERRSWLLDRDPARHPVLVAERAAQVVERAAQVVERAAQVVGWAALSPWSPRPGYARTAEVSVYVAPGARGAGVGHRLMVELVSRGQRAGLGVILARITSSSQASLALHHRLGFERLCVMRRVGEKHGQLIDVELWERQLDAT